MPGTDVDGFHITFEERTRSVRIRAYGFWSPELAASFAPAVLEACRPPRQAIHLVVDAYDLKPQREEGQLAIKSVLAALPALGIERASIVTDNALTKLQLMRLASASATRSMVEFTTKPRGT